MLTFILILSLTLTPTLTLTCIDTTYLFWMAPKARKTTTGLMSEEKLGRTLDDFNSEITADEERLLL
jgi:hypothetical protein